MARHNRYEAVESTDPALDISSLIDVTFLLLIYFLITSAIQIRETDLDTKLAGIPFSATQVQLEPMFIKIAAGGTIYVGTDASQQVMDSDTSVSALPLLSARLDLYAHATRGANQIPLVQIWADNGASQQRLVDVLNALAAVGIQAVTFTDLGG